MHTPMKADRFMVSGRIHCGEFAKLYAENPSITENVYFGWAEGFMSGLNVMATVYKAPYRIISTGDASMQAYRASIRAYCNTHPLAQYAEAVSTLWLSLPPNSTKSSN